MKKYVILIILLIMILIIIIQIKTIKNTKTVQQSPRVGDELKVGKEISKEPLSTPPTASLPIPTVTFPPLEISSPTISQSTQLSNFENTPRCKKTLKDIISEYGKKWGPTQNRYSIPDVSNIIIKLIEEYLTCSAIATKNPSKCNIFSPIKEGCFITYYTYQFDEFLLGVNKNEQDCIKYISMAKEKDIGNRSKVLVSLNISPEKLCSEIKKDIRGICERLFTNMSERDKCYNAIPSIERCPFWNKESCTKAYENAKQNGIYDCDFFSDAPHSKELCWIRKTGENACNVKLNDLIFTYCSYNEILENEKKIKKDKKLHERRDNVNEE